MTKTLALREFAKTDVSTLIEMVDSEVVLQRWARPGLTFPLTRDQLVSSHKALQTQLVYLAELNGMAVGYGEIIEIDRQNLKAKLSHIIIHPNYRAEGLGKQLILKLADQGFELLDLHRIYLNVYSFNHPAIKCYESAGFKKEALLRDYYKLGDKYWSVYRMSLLREEWITRD